MSHLSLALVAAVTLAFVNGQVVPPQPNATGVVPPPPANASAPGLPPTGPQSQPDLSPYPGGQPLPRPAEEPADVTPAQQQSACNATQTIIHSLNTGNANASLPLFSRDAVVNASDSMNDFVITARGKKRIGVMIRSQAIFFGLFGQFNFTVVRTPVDEPNRCLAVVKLSSDILENCPGTANASMYAVLDVQTQNGLVKVVNRTMDSAQHQLVDECIIQKLNQTSTGALSNVD